MADIYDVIIAGGGAAGLSAALVLGRCRRRILLYDDDQHRNSASTRSTVCSARRYPLPANYTPQHGASFSNTRPSPFAPAV